ncbi:MAG: pyridoxal-phosphate dependent enzyme, partial [Peptococcaceae bacterium]|nr:pyridoxal-phosphate dependent enzyme [Peptococcaceae bacterium]
MTLEQTNHLENIQKAAQNLNGIIRKTDLIFSEFFSKETGNRIYIKPENLQRTGSFKIRGAYNRIANLTEEERAKGIIASSAGNHAQGVALAAKAIKPNIQVIGVEPVGASSMLAALDAGKPITLEKVQTAAEGVAVKTVGTTCHDICSKYLDGIIQVSEDEIMEAVLL